MIIQTLREVCLEHPEIYAAWLEGADALNRIDAYSDIDLWLDEEEVIALISSALGSLGKIALEHHSDHPHPKIKQVFLGSRKLPNFLSLTCAFRATAVISHS